LLILGVTLFLAGLTDSYLQAGRAEIPVDENGDIIVVGVCDLTRGDSEHAFATLSNNGIIWMGSGNLDSMTVCVVEEAYDRAKFLIGLDAKRRGYNVHWKLEPRLQRR
jgi:hypothetical protein